jgi:hypothetical protein
MEEGPAIKADGWFVCAGCFEDYALKEVIEANVEDESCDFCSGYPESNRAASLRVVVDHMLQCLSLEYDHAVEHLPYDGREGGYQGWHVDTSDLLEDQLELELPRDSVERKLFRLLCSALGDQLWCEADPARLPEAQRLLYSWEEFCNLLRRGRRFSALVLPPSTEDYEPDRLLSPFEVLQRITQLCQAEGLIKDVPVGTQLYRARELSGEAQGLGGIPLTALELGPPPVQHAAANRMSAAGVPIFYGADQAETALWEVASRAGVLALGTFETQRDVRVLDLTVIPSVPSLFDAERASARQGLMFLHRFAQEISRPVAKDSLVHIEYLPTQVTSEYLRFNFQPGGQPLDGIWYRSSRHRGGRCLALFATRAALMLSPSERGLLTHEEQEQEKRAPWLRLKRAEEFITQDLEHFTPRATLAAL